MSLGFCRREGCGLRCTEALIHFKLYFGVRQCHSPAAFISGRISVRRDVTLNVLLQEIDSLVSSFLLQIILVTYFQLNPMVGGCV